MFETYKEAEETFILDCGDFIKETKTAIVLFTWLRQYASGWTPEERAHVWKGKTDELLRILKEELAGERVVIWFSFNHEVMTCYELLERQGLRVEWITGALSAKRRREIERDFFDKKFDILLAQVECAKHGMNLSASDTAIYFSRPLGLETRSQSEDRIVDVSRSYPSLIIDLVTRDTIDDAVLELLQAKHARSARLLDVARLLKERRKKSF